MIMTENTLVLSTLFVTVFITQGQPLRVGLGVSEMETCLLKGDVICNFITQG